jgi:TonB family protein
MSDFWKRCEGQVIEQKYPLRQFLAGTQSSAVFLTLRSDAPAEKAVIKFISTNPAAVEKRLSRWARAARLSHPNLLRLLDSGRCRLQGRNLLFVVLEFAEENLSQILPERALTTEETSAMIAPVLGALAYLHGKGFAHGHIKPANVHAMGDQIKLSVDTAAGIGESLLAGREADPYDAPELLASPVSRASDAWSLGITLVEALTQHAPKVLQGQRTDPQLPATLPQPFQEIARHVLKRDPALRWTAADIAAHLKLGPPVEREAPSVAVAIAPPVKPAAANISPLDVPLSPERGIPVAKLAAAPPRVIPSQQKPGAAPKKTLVFPNYAIPLVAGICIVAALLVLPRFLRRQESTAPSAATTSTPVPPNRKPAEHAANQTPSIPPTVKDSTRAAVEKAPPASPAPAKLRTEIVPATVKPKLASDSPARGEVLDQVLPQAPDKALNTIHGVVRVVVRVHVDAAGNVSQAELESPGPSRYFADLALKAAQKWVFSSPELDGKSVPSEWLLRFDYSQSGVVALPEQATP